MTLVSNHIVSTSTFVLSTYCLVKYQVRSTKHKAQSTKHKNTKHKVPSTKHKVPSTNYQAQSTKHKLPITHLTGCVRLYSVMNSFVMSRVGEAYINGTRFRSIKSEMPFACAYAASASLMSFCIGSSIARDSFW